MNSFALSFILKVKFLRRLRALMRPDSIFFPDRRGVAPSLWLRSRVEEQRLPVVTPLCSCASARIPGDRGGQAGGCVGGVGVQRVKTSHFLSLFLKSDSEKILSMSHGYCRLRYLQQRSRTDLFLEPRSPYQLTPPLPSTHPQSTRWWRTGASSEKSRAERRRRVGPWDTTERERNVLLPEACSSPESSHRERSCRTEHFSSSTSSSSETAAPAAAAGPSCSRRSFSSALGFLAKGRNKDFQKTVSINNRM